MMGRLELAGTCFARYDYHTAAFPSKADQIMSKYRPIAPKPILVTPSPSDSNSTPSPNSHHSIFSSRKGNTNTESGRSSRTRRKASECSSSPSPKAQKRTRVSNSNNAADLVSESTQIVGTSLPAEGPKSGYTSDVGLKLSVEKDADFTERAANTSFSERSVLGKISAGFEGRPSIKETANSEVGMEDPFKNMEVVGEQKLPQESPWGCGSAKYLVFPIVGDVEQQQEDQTVTNLVTLPLLPEKPSLKDSIGGFLAANSSATVGDPDQKLIRSKVSYDKKDIQFRLFGRDFSIKDTEPCKNSRYESIQLSTSEPILDLSFIKRMYFGSHDPVILLLYNDCSHGQDVLWSNPAYERMTRSLESENHKTNKPQTLMPIPFASFSFKSDSVGTVNSKAILWVFVENFTRPERSPDHGISDNREQNLMPDSSSLSGHHHHNHPIMEIFTNAVSWMPSEGILPINKGVIMPQPVRPVGSYVSIDYINEASLPSSPICKTMDEIEEQIETETFPALVADSKNRVKCANSAYKEMVGQPECTWLDSAAHYCNNKDGSSNSFAMNRINGEVVLKHETPLPASAFSCCARIQWTNNKGEMSAIRAPCNVIKFVTSNPISYVYAWKFHITAAFNGSSRD